MQLETYEYAHTLYKKLHKKILSAEYIVLV